MKAIVFGLLLLSMQTTSTKIPVGSLVGKWITTIAPGPGEAPMISPSFTLALQGGKVVVTFEGETKAEDAAILGSGGGSATENVAVLVIRYPSAASTRTVMLRPIAADQIRCETYMEYAGDRSRGNFYYAEVFKKSK